jgi:hypothetical protein
MKGVQLMKKLMMFCFCLDLGLCFIVTGVGFAGATNKIINRDALLF